MKITICKGTDVILAALWHLNWFAQGRGGHSEPVRVFDLAQTPFIPSYASEVICITVQFRQSAVVW